MCLLSRTVEKNINNVQPKQVQVEHKEAARAESPVIFYSLLTLGTHLIYVISTS